MTTLRIPSRLCAQGFTVMEMMIVGAMTTLLAILFSAAWSGLGQPSADALVRCQVAQEAQLAAAALVADLGGSLPGQTGGTKGNGRLVGRMEPEGSELRLCFDGGGLNGSADWGIPDTVIRYYVEDNKLIRWNETADTTFYVASNVESMTLSDLGNGVQIDLTFTFRDLSRTYTLIAEDP
jgi:type II secretory pathway component PulJ